MRARRRALELSQDALARRADVSLSLVNQMERGVITDPHYSTLVSISRALGTTVIDLLSEEQREVPLGAAPASLQPAAEEPVVSGKDEALSSLHPTKRKEDPEERRLSYLRAWRQFITQMGDRWERKIGAGTTDWNEEPAEMAHALLRVLLDEGVLGEVSKHRDIFPKDELFELLQLGPAVHTLVELTERTSTTEDRRAEIRRLTKQIA